MPKKAKSKNEVLYEEIENRRYSDRIIFGSLAENNDIDDWSQPRRVKVFPNSAHDGGVPEKNAYVEFEYPEDDE